MLLLALGYGLSRSALLRTLTHIVQNLGDSSWRFNIAQRHTGKMRLIAAQKPGNRITMLVDSNFISLGAEVINNKSVFLIMSEICRYTSMKDY